MGGTLGGINFVAFYNNWVKKKRSMRFVHQSSNWNPGCMAIFKEKKP